MKPNDSYKGLKFPPHQHREYPKWVGKKIVHSEAEELLELEALTQSEDTKANGKPYGKRPSA